MNGPSLLLLCCCLAGGIVAGTFQAVPLFAAALPTAAAVAVFVMSLFVRRRNRFRPVYRYHVAASCLLFFGLGVFSGAWSRPSRDYFPKGTYFFRGKVTDFTPTNAGDRLLLDLSFLSSSGSDSGAVRNVRATLLMPEVSDVYYGDVVSGKADFVPFDHPGNVLKVDYENYLRGKHILLTGIAETGEVSVSRSGGGVFSMMRHWRDRLEAGVESTGLDSPTKGFLISILLGDRSYVSPEERNLYADAGVAHIFAVSGFHVSMVAGFVLGVMLLILRGRTRRWAFMLTLPPVWLYVFLTGASPATCRAGIMISIAMAALFLQRKNKPVKALAWAVILILCFNAEALFDVGFRLSVVCVGAILLIAVPLNFIDHRSHPRLHSFVGVLLVSLVASFSCWMVCAFYFHRFSLLFLPLNILAVPLLPLYLLGAVFYVASFHLGLPFPLLGSALDSGFQLFQRAAEGLTSAGGTLSGIYPSGLSLALWLAGLGTLAYFLHRGRAFRRLWIPASVFALSVLSLIFFPTELPSGFILQRGSGEPSVMSYHRGNESLVSFSENVSSAAIVNGRSIVALRSDSPGGNTLTALPEADIIILCDGCRELPSPLPSLIKPGCRLVTHPSLHWRYERRILSDAADAGLPVHSLRYDGPLHIFD